VSIDRSFAPVARFARGDDSAPKYLSRVTVGRDP
jgi:hypothetical protein